MNLGGRHQDTSPGKWCAVVLAGGESRRFGKDKALAQMGDKRLIEYGLDSLRGVFEEALIVAKNPRQLQFLDVPVVCDVIPGAGSLGGILTALIHAPAERCFVVACDMPFLNGSLVRLLLECGQGYDAVVPLVNGEPEPLHAFYSKRCITPILKSILERDYRVIDVYKHVPTLWVKEEQWAPLDPDGLSFVNINTPSDFENALKRLGKGETGYEGGRSL